MHMLNFIPVNSPIKANVTIDIHKVKHICKCLQDEGSNFFMQSKLLLPGRGVLCVKEIHDQGFVSVGWSVMCIYLGPDFAATWPCKLQCQTALTHNQMQDQGLPAHIGSVL